MMSNVVANSCNSLSEGFNFWMGRVLADMAGLAMLAGAGVAVYLVLMLAGVIFDAFSRRKK